MGGVTRVGGSCCSESRPEGSLLRAVEGTWIWVLQQPGNNAPTSFFAEGGTLPDGFRRRPLAGALILPRPPAKQRLHPTLEGHMRPQEPRTP